MGDLAPFKASRLVSLHCVRFLENRRLLNTQSKKRFRPIEASNNLKCHESTKQDTLRVNRKQNQQNCLLWWVGLWRALEQTLSGWKFRSSCWNFKNWCKLDSSKLRIEASTNVKNTMWILIGSNQLYVNAISWFKALHVCKHRYQAWLLQQKTDILAYAGHQQLLYASNKNPRTWAMQVLQIDGGEGVAAH